VHNRCWTADRLERLGLPHPGKCPLCDRKEENIQHLLIQCVVARQFWYYLFNQVGLSHHAPAATESTIDDWWKSVGASVSGEEHKGANSLIILRAWCIWKHRNSCVCVYWWSPFWLLFFYWYNDTQFCIREKKHINNVTNNDKKSTKAHRYECVTAKIN
jgi:hypothetical protein